METLDQNSIAEKLKGVLSDEALTLLLGSEALQDLLETQKDLENNTDKLNDQVNKLVEQKKVMNVELTNLTEKVTEYKNREDSVSIRETTVTENEAALRQAIFERDFFKERGDEFKELQHATVRNTTFRNTLMTEKHTAVEGTPAYNQNGCDYGPTGGYVDTRQVTEDQKKTEE